MRISIPNLLQNKTYRSGAFFSIALNCVAKVLNIAVILIIAYYYGVELKADISFYCINTTMLLAFFLRTINSSVLIPEAMIRRERVSSDDAMAFLNIFLYILVAISGLMLLFLLMDPVSVTASITGFELSVLQEHKHLLTLAMPLLPLMAISFFLTDILFSHKCFTLPMILDSLTHLIVIIAAITLHDMFDIASIIIGMLAGYTLQLLLLLIIMKFSLGWKYSLHSTSIPRKVWHDVGVALAGNFMTTFSAYLPLILFSHIGGGLIASLNYAKRIAELPHKLITIQFSSVFGIRMNQLFAEEAWEKVDSIFRECAELLLFILVPFSAYVFIYSSDIINLLYVHGNFDAGSSVMTASILRVLALVTPCMAVITLASRLFMAGRKVIHAFWFQLILNAVVAVSVTAGVHIWGYIGYPIAQLTILLLHATAGCAYLLSRFFKMIHYSATVKYIFFSIAINSAIAAVLYLVRNTLPYGSVLQLTIGGALYVAIVIILDRFMIVNHTARRMRKSFFSMITEARNNYRRTGEA